VTNGPMKWVRAAVAVVVLVSLALIVRGWWRQYKSAPRPSQDTTQTAEPIAPTDTQGEEAPAAAPEAGDTAAAPTVLVVRTDGLNFRVKPDSTSEAIRGLEKGETLTVVTKDGDWYQVKTAKGETGWITDNPSYTSVQKQ